MNRYTILLTIVLQCYYRDIKKKIIFFEITLPYRDKNRYFFLRIGKIIKYTFIRTINIRNYFENLKRVPLIIIIIFPYPQIQSTSFIADISLSGQLTLPRGHCQIDLSFPPLANFQRIFVG